MYMIFLLISISQSFMFNKKNYKFTPVYNYNLDGDLSGSYKLSGLWKLYREPIPKIENNDPNLVWSGNKWSSPNRIFFSNIYLILDSEGSFFTPKDSITRNFYGKWSCNDNELSLTRYRCGYNAFETYTGLYYPINNGTIYGEFCYGAIEPEYSGKFIMTRLMQLINPIKKNYNVNIFRHKVFQIKDLVGKWQLDVEKDFSFLSVNIVLYKNLTWESVDSYSNLVGIWNIYEESIDVTSGIHGEGYKFWLLIRRFSKTINGKSNINIEQDCLYTGIIRRSPQVDNSVMRPRDIRGDVSIGWQIEQAFIGNFRMRPIF